MEKLGRKCWQSDYAPCGAQLTFRPCDEREWRGPPLPFKGYFLGDPKKKADGHYKEFEDVMARADAAVHKSASPSIPLKAYFKAGWTEGAVGSHLPSQHEVQQLAKEHLEDGSEEGIATIKRWFSERRLQLLMKDAARRAQVEAAADRTLKEDEAELVIARLTELCAPFVPAMQQAKTPKQKRVALLQSEQMGGICSGGSMAVVSSRIYEYREFVISTFSLDKHSVYTAIEIPDPVQSRTCSTCNTSSFDTSNPMILCDGCNGCFHILCENLDYVPHADWLCCKCVESDLYLIEEVLDKRRQHGRVEYLIRWAGHSGEEDDERTCWQAVADIPRGKSSLATEKINEFNRARARREIGCALSRAICNIFTGRLEQSRRPYIHRRTDRLTDRLTDRQTNR